MVPASATPSYQLRGAIGYLRDEQRLPAMGMGLVARFGGHNAAICLGLQENENTGAIASRSSQSSCALIEPKREDQFLADSQSYQNGYSTSGRCLQAEFACLIYGRSGQFLEASTTGRQLDLVA
ncbi:MAG TPA: hypothetical protein VM163_13400 [bacterium]|nr:hypothetical protein [bacterium]